MHELIRQNDTFPLWSFGYRELPTDPNEMGKVMTSRGRTPNEAWICIQDYGRSFREPSKTALIAVVSLIHKDEYDKTHPYNWLHDAPAWLKRSTGQYDLIW